MYIYIYFLFLFNILKFIYSKIQHFLVSKYRNARLIASCYRLVLSQTAASRRVLHDSITILRDPKKESLFYCT